MGGLALRVSHGEVDGAAHERREARQSARPRLAAPYILRYWRGGERCGGVMTAPDGAAPWVCSPSLTSPPAPRMLSWFWMCIMRM